MIIRSISKFMVMVSIFFSGVSFSCVWHGGVESHDRYKMDIGFIGELIEKGEERNDYGELEYSWAKFRPVKPIKGQWSESKEIFFNKHLDMPTMVKGWFYVIHGDKDGNYKVPCHDFGPRYFTSVDSEAYKNYIKQIQRFN